MFCEKVVVIAACGAKDMLMERIVSDERELQTIVEQGVAQGKAERAIGAVFGQTFELLEMMLVVGVEHQRVLAIQEEIGIQSSPFPPTMQVGHTNLGRDIGVFRIGPIEDRRDERRDVEFGVGMIIVELAFCNQIQPRGQSSLVAKIGATLVTIIAVDGARFLFETCQMIILKWLIVRVIAIDVLVVILNKGAGVEHRNPVCHLMSMMVIGYSIKTFIVVVVDLQMTRRTGYERGRTFLNGEDGCVDLEGVEVVELWALDACGPVKLEMLFATKTIVEMKRG